MFLNINMAIVLKGKKHIHEQDIMNVVFDCVRQKWS